MIGVERIKLLLPLRQDLHEVAPSQKGRETHGETLDDPVARHAGGDRNRRIVQYQATRNLDVDEFALAVELPGKRQAGLRIAEEQNIVMDKVVRGAWLPVPL